MGIILGTEAPHGRGNEAKCHTQDYHDGDGQCHIAYGNGKDDMHKRQENRTDNHQSGAVSFPVINTAK